MTASLFFSVVVAVMGVACKQIGVEQSSARQMRVCSLESGGREVDFFFIVWSCDEKESLIKLRKVVEIFLCECRCTWPHSVPRSGP